jgi:hypothetical protein
MLSLSELKEKNIQNWQSMMNVVLSDRIVFAQKKLNASFKASEAPPLFLKIIVPVQSFL